MKDSFDLHSWYLKQYSLYETDDPKIGAEEEGDPNEFVVGEVDSLKYSISEYITENKNVMFICVCLLEIHVHCTLYHSIVNWYRWPFDQNNLQYP